MSFWQVTESDWEKVSKKYYKTHKNRITEIMYKDIFWYIFWRFSAMNQNSCDKMIEPSNCWGCVT